MSASAKARPSREQIAQSREYVSGLLESYELRSMMSGAEIGAIHVLLATTAEPNEEELREEAVVAVLTDCGLEGEEAAEVRAHILDSLPYTSDNVDHAAEARAYIRGARREGRRATPPCSLCHGSGWVGGSAEVEHPTRCMYGCADPSGGAR